MMEALVMLASMMTTDECIERLQRAIEEYKEAELLNSENLMKLKGELIMSAHLLTLHISNEEKGIDGAISTIERLKQIQKADQFFKTPKN